ncbi:MAG: peptide chain release factor aRF-1 [Candidatus Micrarchaeia archaeon]
MSQGAAQPDSKARFDFKKQVEALKAFRGRGTELISVYVTPKYPISEIAGKLRDEYGQAANIKSKSTQKNVQAALEKIMNHLKTYKAAPENGVAIFAGNVSENEGKTDYRLYAVEPPEPLGVQFYRCESVFVVEPLEELLDHAGAYGIIVMDGKEATIAVLKGKQVKIIKRLNSTAHQKVSKGGQSAARYSRLHVEGVEFYYKRIGEAMDAFVGIKNFQGIVVGGPGPAKHDFVKMSPFNYQLKILGVVDTGYTDEYGIRETMEKAKDVLSEQESIKEKAILDEFLKRVAKGGLAAYGLTGLKEMLERGQVERLLVTEGMELWQVKQTCGNCGKERVKIQEHPGQEEPCECGGKWMVKEEHDLANELVAIAEEKGVPVELASRETAEGNQFYGMFNGLGAFLKYK